MAADQIVGFLQSLPPELVWVMTLCSAFAVLLLMLRLFGAWGATVYMCVALITANLQVLKTVEFGVFNDPVALGTVLFATTFLSTDILTEYYGPKAARRAVLLGFSGMLFLTAMMIFTLGFEPLDESFRGGDWSWGLENHEHLSAVFMPIPSILIAGFAAYLISQILDIWVYQKIRTLTHDKYRWLRNNGSTWISAFVDNCVFSILAWIVLAAQPIEWMVVWKTYILGTYFLRIGVALLDTPILYLAGFCRPAADKQ